MGRTKEERYIIGAYEAIKKSGDMENIMDRYQVGTKVGLNPKGVDTICRDLAQANFLKFHGQGIRLTEQGLALIENLLG